jgi:hypothetical protein
MNMINASLEKRLRIKRVREIKELIERENPEIVPEYKNGRSRREIALGRGLHLRYRIKIETAMHIVSLIVYDSIPYLERARIAKKHERDGAKKTHKHQERNHSGIHADLDEDNLNDARKGAVEARGYSVWTAEQRRYLQRLASSKEFQWQEGPHKGLPNYELIVIPFNENFPNSPRNARSISLQYFKLRHPEKKYKR